MNEWVACLRRIYFDNLHFPVAAAIGMVTRPNKLPPLLGPMQSGISAAPTPSANGSRRRPPLSCSLASSDRLRWRDGLYIFGYRPVSGLTAPVAA